MWQVGNCPSRTPEAGPRLSYFRLALYNTISKLNGEKEKAGEQTRSDD